MRLVTLTPAGRVPKCDWICGHHIAKVIMGTVVLMFACVPKVVSGQQNTQRGATLGGLGGAIAGAIIGDNNNEAGAGAAIGGAIGAVAGGLLGNARDKELRGGLYPRTTIVPPQSVSPVQPMYAPTPQPLGAVAMNDVIAMSRSGVSEAVILNQIQTRGVARQTQVSDIISLHQQGVSEAVITAMQSTSVAESVVALPPSTIVTPAPVVVKPRIYRHPSVYHYGPVYRARPRVHFQFGR